VTVTGLDTVRTIWEVETKGNSSSISGLHAGLPERRMMPYPASRGNPMRIESVQLVALPNAPAWQEKVYRAHLDTGEDMDLFQQHWDVPLPPESLVGLTVEEARRKRNDRMFAIASGNR
jgi:hypothetical protein